MKTLTAKDLLSAQLEIVKLDIPGLGELLIKEPTGHERSEYESFVGTLNDDPDGLKILRAFCAVRCLVDGEGNRLFKNDEADTVNRTVSARMLEAILDRYNALLLNTDKDIAKAAKK